MDRTLILNITDFMLENAEHYIGQYFRNDDDRNLIYRYAEPFLGESLLLMDYKPHDSWLSLSKRYPNLTERTSEEKLCPDCVSCTDVLDYITGLLSRSPTCMKNPRRRLLADKAGFYLMRNYDFSPESLHGLWPTLFDKPISFEE